MATQTETLSSYLTKLRRLLHDAQDVYWSAAAKTAIATEVTEVTSAATAAEVQCRRVYFAYRSGSCLSC